MILAISHSFLQEYWWFLISLLGSLLVFLMFVQGGQSFIFTLAAGESQKTMIINSMGRKWEFTFTTLVTFGGAFFASFPLFYATSFGGAYWVWIAILFSFVIQAVSFEFRTKPSNILGRKTFEIFLFINGALGPLLIGTAVGTFFTGSNFTIDQYNIGQWENPWHGLEALLNLRNLSLGITVLFLARLLGLMYIINTVDDSELLQRARRKTLVNLVPFLIAFLYFVITLLLAEGFATDPGSSEVFMEKFKYLINLIQMPPVLIMFLAGTVLILLSLYLTVIKKSGNGIWYSGIGTVMVVLSLFCIAGYNNTSFYPSAYDLQSSLTITNSSSSHFTLNTMMIVSFFIPVVIVYIWFAWRSINRSKITSEEMESDQGHVY
ncbi:MAG TPA: cytochrome d ubiquinol oxidase subunit II [Bacteroidales bacterium]|nr:cytochrome d ubiquinol oxidase subunit II [Bacteroidales bacterium]